jgi:hypothetical protein
MSKDRTLNGPSSAPDAEDTEHEVEAWVPLSLREARLARKRRDDLWPYIWMNFVSMIIVFASAVVLAYRMGAHSCHEVVASGE